MRIQSIDTLRGFAILGILVMNVGFHLVILTGYVNFDPILVVDRTILILQGIFADGRFRTLFCLLFGSGLAILYEHCERKGLDAKLFIKSRLFWLLIFGIIHAVFIFGGDILMLYAISGFILIKHLPKSQEDILSLAKKWFVVGSILGFIFAGLALTFTPEEDIMTRSSSAFLSKYALVYKNYFYFIGSNALSAVFLLLIAMVSFLWQVLGIMLFGIYLYRSQFFKNGFSARTLKLIIVAAVILTGVNVAPLVFMEQVDTTITPMLASISAFFVALIYAHLFIKVFKKESWLTTTLANCGKVAFTLYIGQSIIMAIIFKLLLPALNPDFIDSINLLHLMMIVVIMSILQMLFANFILSRYQSGPLEALWRKCYLNRYNKKYKAAQT